MFHYHKGFYSVNFHKLTSMAKFTLDEHCGRTSKDFNSKILFANHFKTHSDEVFKCPKCPDVWENGPENQFNSKKANVVIKNIVEIIAVMRKFCEFLGK